MDVFFQTLLVVFALIGLFNTLWQIILFFTRKAAKNQRIRIVIDTNEDLDPASLVEDLHLLNSRFATCNDLRIWLLCPRGAKQERTCRYVAERDCSVRVIAPEQLQNEIKAFTENL